MNDKLDYLIFSCVIVIGYALIIYLTGYLWHLGKKHALGG
jgi:hypothetical protein